MIRELGVQEFVLVVLPLVLLVGWIIFFRRQTYGALLTVSILLVIVDLPYLFLIPTLFRGGGIFGMTSLPLLLFILFFGVGCFILGIFGIIASIKGFSRRSVG